MALELEAAAKVMESAEALENSASEMTGGREIPSMAELKEKMQKEFPQPDAADGLARELPAKPEGPSKVTLEDGTEVVLPVERPPQDGPVQNVEQNTIQKTDISDKEIRETIVDYCNDIKDKSVCPETIPDEPFTPADIHIRTPEENALMRERFSEIKGQLKKEWEDQTGLSWPKYDHDIYSANGKLIRKAGSDFDAHHIQPLALGGENEAKNITPLSAEVHYDKQGVHAPDSPYSKLVQQTGGIEQ